MPDRYGDTTYDARITVEHTGGPGAATDAQVAGALKTLLYIADSPAPAIPNPRDFVIGDDNYAITAVTVREHEPARGNAAARIASYMDSEDVRVNGWDADTIAMIALAGSAG